MKMRKLFRPLQVLPQKIFAFRHSKPSANFRAPAGIHNQPRMPENTPDFR